MKTTTYIAEITTQKSICLKEKSTCLLDACLLALCKLRNFPCEFTEKCFAVFD